MAESLTRYRDFPTFKPRPCICCPDLSPDRALLNEPHAMLLPACGRHSDHEVERACRARTVEREGA